MKIVMNPDQYGKDDSYWFMNKPIDGPAYVALCRVREAWWTRNYSSPIVVTL